MFAKRALPARMSAVSATFDFICAPLISRKSTYIFVNINIRTSFRSTHGYVSLILQSHVSGRRDDPPRLGASGIPEEIDAILFQFEN
jgi:hypothetical protein